MKQEIMRRLDILKGKEIPVISRRGLRGGMRNRLRRQRILTHGKNVTTQKRKLQHKLSIIEEAEKAGTYDSLIMEPLGDFNEPFFKDIRDKRGLTLNDR